MEKIIQNDEVLSKQEIKEMIPKGTLYVTPEGEVVRNRPTGGVLQDKLEKLTGKPVTAPADIEAAAGRLLR